MKLQLLQSQISGCVLVTNIWVFTVEKWVSPNLRPNWVVVKSNWRDWVIVDTLVIVLWPQSRSKERVVSGLVPIRDLRRELTLTQMIIHACLEVGNLITCEKVMLNLLIDYSTSIGCLCSCLRYILVRRKKYTARDALFYCHFHRSVVSVIDFWVFFLILLFDVIWLTLQSDYQLSLHIEEICLRVVAKWALTFTVYRGRAG